DIFDYTFNFLGEVEGDEEQIVRGNPGEGSFSVFYAKNELLKATFLLRRPITEYNIAGSLILNRVSLERFKGKLKDTEQALDKIPLQVVLVLQGGGALGAFECGVVKAMEERGIYPDIVAGISIGAFNAAIIASNPKRAADALCSFWEELAIDIPEIPPEGVRRLASAWFSIIFGNPSFFKPKWLMPTLTPPYFWKSLYDTSPIAKLLEKYVDFQGLKDSPVRLLVSAVNVETGELETWDSYTDDLTPQHVLASGSLPPALPWTTIEGRHYWDGGIVTNTPLNQVIELCGLSGKKVYVVNLYSKERALPQNMLEVMSRKDEIFYSEKVRSEIQTIEILENFKKLVEELMGRLDQEAAEQIMHRPLYISTMGYYPPLSIVRITHEGPKWELPSKDFDFSRRSILLHIEEGYKEATRVLAEEEKEKHTEVKK
ncbi:MAG: patatin-like phospholipase family protein, partial [Candidatus Caldarchaeum sp.]